MKIFSCILIITSILVIGCNDVEPSCTPPASYLGSGAKLVRESCVSSCNDTYFECDYILDNCVIHADCDLEVSKGKWNEDSRFCY